MTEYKSQPQKSYKSYADIQEDTKDLLRQNLIDAADYLMRNEGPEALTVRRIAGELNASTKVLYSLFGGKDGLANELYAEGSVRLRQFIEKVPKGDDVRDYVTKSCWAYWDFAEAHRSYYQIMFANAIPHFQPDKKALATVGTAFEVLSQILSAYQEEGALPKQDIEDTIHFLCAPLHGGISLYHSNHYDEAGARALYQKVSGAMIAYLLKK